MAEEQKPVVEVPEVAKEQTTPAAAVDAAAAEVAPEVKTTDETKPVADVEAGAKAEETKAEVKPVEEGHLGHKAQGASFPKNLIASKEFFFFGSDSFDPKTLATYLKNEKHVQQAQHNISWAAHTGKGLLFAGDKKAPTNVINLADASEPEVDGPNKFHFTHKGNKHTFKATTATERDGWVAQLKSKIAEAKELASNVTESDVYKNTIAGFKPAVAAAPVKEEKPVEEAAKTDEAAKAEETPKEEEAAKEAAKEEAKTEETKRRSASRKRGSIFGFGKKESTKEKKDEAKPEETVAAAETAEPAVETEAPKAEETQAGTHAPPLDIEANAAAATAAPVTADAPVTDAAATETKATEDVSPAESPKEKPSASKRNSFFGGVFSKKEKKSTEIAKPTEEATKEVKEGEDATATDATAPVIPPVESTTPLAVDVSNPATVPTENVEVGATNGEAAKKDVKERRKSSLPFNFGKRDKSPVAATAAADGEEKTADKPEKSGKSAFSKLRATIKGKSGAKTEEKPAAEAVKEEAAKDETAATDAAATTTEEPAPAAEAAVKGTEAEAETENKPENVASATPAVTAAA